MKNISLKLRNFALKIIEKKNRFNKSFFKAKTNLKVLFKDKRRLNDLHFIDINLR